MFVSSPTQLPSGSRWDRLFCWLLLLPAVTALGVYLTTLSRGAFPGESAWLVAQATGLTPRLYLDRPLWTLTIAALARLPSHDFMLWFNGLSAACGALAVYLCSRLVATVVQRVIPVYLQRQRPGAVAVAALLAGCCAGGFLAFSTPFWIAATRAHPATLHLAGLLAVALLLLNYTRRPTDGRLAGLVFLYAVGSVEFATFIVFAPLAGGFLLLFLWLRDLLSVRRICLSLAAALAGGSLYFITAWMYTRTEGFVLRDFQGFWHVLWIYWGDQYRLITRGLPRHGWMLTLTVTVIPWMIGWFTIRRGLGGDRDPAFRLLSVVITALTLLVLFNHSITPWRLLGASRLLVTPYLLSATLFGILSAAWFLFPLYCTANAERGWRLAVNRWGGLIPALLALGLVSWAPFRNFSAADGRPAELINHYAAQIVRSAAGREWLISDGSLDYHLMIAAHTQGQPLQILNLAAGNNPVYLRHLATRFESLRLRGLLQAGLQAFLREWLTTQDIADRVAVLSTPDLWIAADFMAVPHRFVFRGYRSGDLPDADVLWSDYTAFMADTLPMLQRYHASGSALWSRAADQFLRHAGLTANNLGVLLEDMGREDLAWQAYRQARAIDSDNISALLNLSIMARRPGVIPEPLAEEIRAGMGQLAATLGARRFQIRRLSQWSGYVRMPQAFADMGWTWALSGNPNLAVSGLKRALALSENVPGARAALAAVYLAQEKDEESETVYREMLERNPRDPQAFIGLARIAIQRRQFDAATAYIASAEEAGAPSDRLLFEQALISLLAGDIDLARTTLETLVALQPETPRAWVLLAHIAMRQDDPTRLGRIVRQISPLAAHDFAVAFALGEFALASGNSIDARRHFEQALSLRPGNTYILEILLKLDLREARQDLAQRHVEKLLGADPEHAFGNYVLGTLQIRNHQYGLAESSLRQSLAAQRTPYALNDLVEILIDRGRFSEAEILAREAVSLAPEVYQTHSALGHVLLRLRRLPEALSALERALALNSADTRAGIDSAEVWMLQGAADQALDRIAALLAPDSPVTLSQRERLAVLQRTIRQSRALP